MTNGSSPGVRVVAVLRAATFVDAVVFLTAALLNAGTTIPLGFADLRFPVPIWQAGVGEAVIGLALLATTVTGRATIQWVALGMSVFGIVFGLSSPRVQGPARDVHVLLVPLAVIVCGLLLWRRQQSRWPRPKMPRAGADDVTMAAFRGTGRARRRPISMAICGLMVIATGAFAVASMIHFGIVVALGPVIIDDPFPGAAIPEAVIAVVLGVGSLAAIARWPAARRLAAAATLFALSATVYGLNVTARSSRTGDIVYHVGILVVLGVIVGLLLLSAGRRNLSEDRSRSWGG